MRPQRSPDLVAPGAQRGCLRGDRDFSLTARFDRWAQRLEFIFYITTRTDLTTEQVVAGKGGLSGFDGRAGQRTKFFVGGCRIDPVPFVVSVRAHRTPLEWRPEMRKLIVTEFMTLDGVIDSGGSGDHPHAGWTFKDVEFDEAVYEIKGREQDEAGALLLGRMSYDEFAPVWPMMEEFAEYNAMPKYVVSTTLTNPTWNDTTVLRSLDEVTTLKEGEGGPLLVHGSATLAQNLAAADLVDRYHLLIFPVLLGSGKRLFTDSSTDKTKLKLVEHATYNNGVQMAIYDVVR